jgi:8-oxo-dGTP pyrophosphatase MutT (NUDIX family)
MGSGILPITWYKGELHFLFGKENKYADTPGWSDFGGGRDNKESAMQTAIREAGEELTGFLGSDKDVSRLLKKGFYPIERNGYKMHLFYYPYNPYLVDYYNNNQRFLQTHLDPKVIQNTKIFEKAEIRWVPFSQLKRMIPQFRSYFREIINDVLSKRGEIASFFKKSCKTMSQRTQRNKSKKTTTRKN